MEYLDVQGIWNMRMQTGALVTDKRFVRFGTKGCADILATVDAPQ